MTTPDTPPQPADHPLLRHRAIWLLTGRSPAWLAAARQFIAEPQGPLMRWRASECLLQVVDTQALNDTLQALLDLQPADLTLVCEPGLLQPATEALRQTLPNLTNPPPANALRASEQRPPFSALLPRLQQPEPSLAAAWLDWAMAKDTPDLGSPAASADDWCALTADDGMAAPAPPPELQPRVAAAAVALADWSARFSASFAPGELAQTFAGADAVDADEHTPPQPQPGPLLQPFRPRPTDDGWMVLRPDLASSPQGYASAAAESAPQAEDGIWQATGRFPGPAHDGQATELGHYALALDGDELNATLTLHVDTLRGAPEPGQTLALAVRAADGMGLRLLGPAGPRPAGGSWAIRLKRHLSTADAAQLRAQPADSVVAELWWAPGA